MAKLDLYRKKRDEDRTNEPFGSDPEAGIGPTWNGVFVVHLHDATRKHYDLRLERGGVLLSFAVPHGPSLDPAEKHLAIQTEDHPIEYLDFEAVIPDGLYGAGPMIVWDRGRVTYRDTCAEDGLARGKLLFELQGYKLRGSFELIRTKRDPKDWLLFKKTDNFASKTRDITVTEPRSVLSGLTVDELARSVRIEADIEARAKALPGARPGRPDGTKLVPMLCATTQVKLDDPDFLYELKLDGMRILAQKEGDKVTLTNRKLRDYTTVFPEITRAMAALPAKRVILDGEAVAFDAAGKPSFGRVAQRLHLTRHHEIRLQMAEIPVAFIVFDILAFDDTDLMGVPLSERKSLLRDLLHGAGVLRMLDHLDGNGQPLIDFCRANKLEGVVAKRKSARYEPGPKRGGDWVKIKCERDAEFVVVGLARGEGQRKELGALDLATYEDGKLVHRGKVGSGLDDKTIAQLLERLPPLAVPEKQAEGEYMPAPTGRLHIKPEVVVSVRFLGWSDDGHARFPVFRGIRDDVNPKDCTASPTSGDSLEAAAPTEKPAQTEPVPAAPRKVHVTNKTKVLFPETGITKGELLAYYESIAPAMLPYLKDRPVALVRYPDGIHGKSFYQWNVPQGVPTWIKSAYMPHDDGQDRHVFLINDVESLLVVANLAAIPIHILASRAASREECEFFTVDLDVELATFEDGVILARTLREMLEGFGLPSFLKTSGQSGLHVMVPLPRVPYEAAKMLCELVGRLLVQRHPDRATMERVIAKRGARVFVDVGQTGRSRTIVAPWSVRAKPVAPVSMPLRWEELTKDLDPSAFTIRTARARYDAIGDPMAGLLTEKSDVASAMAKLQAEVVRAGGLK